MRNDRGLFVVRSTRGVAADTTGDLLGFVRRPLPNVCVLLLAAGGDTILPAVHSHARVVRLRPLPGGVLRRVLSRTRVPINLRSVTLKLASSATQVGR